jgi:hypothetical protein
MMAAMFPFALILLLLGGGNSLLDQVDSGAFWAAEGVTVSAEAFRQELQSAAVQAPPDVDALIRQLGADRFQDRENATQELRKMGASVETALRGAQQNKDPEIAMRSAELLKALQPRKKPSALRRVMALRGLADMAEKQDEALFLSLVEDADRDVAREAKRALRRLRNEADAPLPALPAAEVFLPAETANLLELTLKPFPKEGPPNRIRPLHLGVLPMLEALGDARVDRITLGSSAVMNGNIGWALVVLDGEYNPARLSAWLLEEKRTEKVTRGQLELLRIDDEIVIIPLNERRLVVMLAGNEKAMPLDALLASLSSPPADSKLPEALTALRKDVPEASVLRLFVTAPQTLPIPLEECKHLKNFRILGEPNEKGLRLVGSGEPVGPNLLDPLVAKRKQSLQEIRPMIQQNAEGMNAKPLLDMIDSLRMTVDETTYTMELLIPANIYEVIVPFLGFLQPVHQDIEDMNMPEHMEQIDF